MKKGLYMVILMTAIFTFNACKKDDVKTVTLNQTSSIAYYSGHSEYPYNIDIQTNSCTKEVTGPIIDIGSEGSWVFEDNFYTDFMEVNNERSFGIINGVEKTATLTSFKLKKVFISDFRFSDLEIFKEGETLSDVFENAKLIYHNGQDEPIILGASSELDESYAASYFDGVIFDLTSSSHTLNNLENGHLELVFDFKETMTENRMLEYKFVVNFDAGLTYTYNQ